MTASIGPVLTVILLVAPAKAAFAPFADPIIDTIVTTQYPGVTFSSPTVGRDIRAANVGDLGSSLPLVICSQPIGGFGSCLGDIQLDFASPVNDLSFLSVGDDRAFAAAALVDVYASFALAATLNLPTDGTPFVPQLFDLSAFSDITRIVIRNQVDIAGLGFDDFRFTAVPEPATFLRFGTGIVAGIRRRLAGRRS